MLGAAAIGIEQSSSAILLHFGFFKDKKVPARYRHAVHNVDPQVAVARVHLRRHFINTVDLVVAVALLYLARSAGTHGTFNSFQLLIQK